MLLRGWERQEITSGRRLCVKAHERGCWAAPAELHQQFGSRDRRWHA